MGVVAGIEAYANMLRTQEINTSANIKTVGGVPAGRLSVLAEEIGVTAGDKRRHLTFVLLGEEVVGNIGGTQADLIWIAPGSRAKARGSGLQSDCQTLGDVTSPPNPAVRAI